MSVVRVVLGPARDAREQQQHGERSEHRQPRRERRGPSTRITGGRRGEEGGRLVEIRQPREVGITTSPFTAISRGDLALRPRRVEQWEGEGEWEEREGEQRRGEQRRGKPRGGRVFTRGKLARPAPAAPPARRARRTRAPEHNPVQRRVTSADDGRTRSGRTPFGVARRGRCRLMRLRSRATGPARRRTVGRALRVPSKGVGDGTRFSASAAWDST